MFKLFSWSIIIQNLHENCKQKTKNHEEIVCNKALIKNLLKKKRIKYKFLFKVAFLVSLITESIAISQIFDVE